MARDLKFTKNSIMTAIISILDKDEKKLPCELYRNSIDDENHKL